MSDWFKTLLDVDKRIQQIDDITYPFKNDPENWISMTDKWIMYPEPSIKNKEEGRSANFPNIWVGINPNDQNLINMGIAFQTKALMVDTILQLHEYPNEEPFNNIINIFSKISNNWNFVVFRKTKWNTHQSTPIYSPQREVPCNTINEILFKELLSQLKEIQATARKQGDVINGKKIFYEGASIDFMRGTFPIDGEYFSKAVNEIFSIFPQCLEIKNSKHVSAKKLSDKTTADMIKGKIRNLNLRLKSPSLKKGDKEHIKSLISKHEKTLKELPEELLTENVEIKTPKKMIEWVESKKDCLQIKWNNGDYRYYIDVFHADTFKNECLDVEAIEEIYDRKQKKLAEKVPFLLTVKDNIAVLKYPFKYADKYSDEIDLGELRIEFLDSSRSVINKIKWFDYVKGDISGDESNESIFSNWDIPSLSSFSDFKMKTEKMKKTTVTTRDRSEQSIFKYHMNTIYNHKCCITDCEIVEILEAAHLVPVKDDGSNDPRNGILIRSDIHKLLDAGLIRINPDKRSIEICSKLKGTLYEDLDNRLLNTPMSPFSHLKPHIDALKYCYNSHQ